jgi:hypothetical protein
VIRVVGRVALVAIGLAVAATLVAGAGVFARAADVAVFGGSEMAGHGQSYSYLGADVTQRLTDTWSLTGRVAPHYLTYKYRSDGELISATAPGVDLAVGLKLTLGATWASLRAGIQMRDTDLSPDDPGADARGETIAPLVIGEFGTTLPSRTSITYFGSFGGADHFLYQKLGVKQHVTNLDRAGAFTLHAGGELFGGRNVDFSMIGVGPVVELYHVPSALSIAVRAGYRWDSTFDSGFFAGFSFYRQF